MTTTIIIVICVLLLIAYVFDLSAGRTKVPAVILLLLLGYVVKQITERIGLTIPDISQLLPILGTVGLILIVLEGALELELNASKLPLIKSALIGAIWPMFVMTVLLTLAFTAYTGASIKDSIINAIPFCVISSAIAIPSVKNLSAQHREYIIYESSLSDIVGVLLFNFFALNETINAAAFGHFSLQVVIMLVIAVVATLALAFLLNKIEHHIKFIPIILLIILIYSLSKIYHLPGLIFILIFGLSLGNLDKLKNFTFSKRFNTGALATEVLKFKELNIELAFLVRAVFFIVFGFLIDSSEVLNTNTLPWALLIVVLIFSLRALQLKFSKLPLKPLLFVAPRGLITILLFLSIESDHAIAMVNNALIVQVILLTAVLTMVGVMGGERKTNL